MRLKAYVIAMSVLIGAFSMTSCDNASDKENDKDETATSNDPMTVNDRFSYSYGVLIGSQMKAQQMTSKDIDADELAKAIKATLDNDPASLPIQMADAQKELQSFFQKQQEAKMKEAEAQAGPKRQEEEKWFAENVDNKPNIQKTSTGLRYEILKEGNGPKPKATDKVKVHYHGTRIDGKVFDSSVDRGQPAVFEVGRLIPAWIEALQMMPTGSKWKIYVPFDMGYGARGAGADIPAFSTLIFEMELFSIEG
ncbi:MAG: FKBP-type peptidyl-prolyl cis-trans isomerase [Saprospiraceae bacterium]|nr:FKBP-type peptidyl-prolyl cis-trans isomerase [Saprospiraceae bacterium]